MASRASIRSSVPLPADKPREETALEAGLLTGFAVFRWAAWTWAVVVLGLNIARQGSGSPDRPWAGAVILILALGWTVAVSVLARRSPERLLDAWALAVEGAVALIMVVLDWWVYGEGEHSQSLGTIWPLAVILTAGVVHGVPGGLLTGLGIGLARSAGDLLFLPDPFGQGDHQLAASGTVVLYALAGAVAGFLVTRLRQAEREIAVARAREEVARTLHDGVLQTLAIVQRRALDDDLVALARDQEHELREFLFTTRPGARTARTADRSDLAAALRATAAEAERRHRVRCQVVTLEDLPLLPDTTTRAVAGAVGEALTNAAKHGGATNVTVFVEPTDDGGIFCSVKDDGAGFDPATISEGVGLSRSIRGRIEEIGGHVEIDGRPGRGAEVRITIP